jgi:hypothetical protein
MIAVISVIIIAISIALLCIETLPEVKKCQQSRNDFNITSNLNYQSLCFYLNPLSVFVIETICTGWFTMELLMRFISAPNKFQFVKASGNIVDLISILPYILQVTETSSRFGILRIIRVVRVFRIFKLARHFKGLQILAQTFKSSANELAMLSLFMMIGIVLFSSCVYFIEIDSENSDFQSIPGAFWYTLITMTTVSHMNTKNFIFYRLILNPLFQRSVMVTWCPKRPSAKSWVVCVQSLAYSH